MAPQVETNRSLVSTMLSLFISHWAIALPALIISRYLYRRYASPLRKYPGPVLASFSRLWKVMSTYSGRTHLQHVELHRKHGRIVRIAPNEISIASPEAARLVLSAGKHFYKTDFYAVFPPPENPDIFTETDEEKHARKKKVANVPYSMAAMRKLSPFIDDTVDFLMSRLDGFAAGRTGEEGGEGAKKRLLPNKETAVDLGKWLHWFAFDVLGEVAFSRPFGFLEQGKDVEGAIRTIDNSQMYNGVVGQVPELDRLLRRNPLWKLVPALSTGNAPITRLALDELARRRPFDKESEGKLRSGDGRQDLMASLITGHLKDPEMFGEGDVFAVAHGAIFAGSDSTASTMQSFFWHVLSDPRVKAALAMELSDAVTSGTIPATGNLSWNESQALPYFQACLKEAMRVRPAVGLNITRYVPPEGAVLDGEFIPGGTRVALNGWVLHRDTKIFGQDADLFRPERWLVGEDEARRMERYMFQFGGGAHLCIGRNLALLEINKVVPRILRDYELDLAYPDQPLRANATFFVVQEGLEVYIRNKKR